MMYVHCTEQITRHFRFFENVQSIGERIGSGTHVQVLQMIYEEHHVSLFGLMFIK